MTDSELQAKLQEATAANNVNFVQSLVEKYKDQLSPIRLQLYEAAFLTKDGKVKESEKLLQLIAQEVKKESPAVQSEINFPTCNPTSMQRLFE